jgi:hypothetical protein
VPTGDEGDIWWGYEQEKGTGLDLRPQGQFCSSLFFDALRDSVRNRGSALVLDFYSDKTAVDAL